MHSCPGFCNTGLSYLYEFWRFSGFLSIDLYFLLLHRATGKYDHEVRKAYASKHVHIVLSLAIMKVIAMPRAMPVLLVARPQTPPRYSAISLWVHRVGS